MEYSPKVTEIAKAFGFTLEYKEYPDLPPKNGSLSYPSNISVTRENPRNFGWVEVQNKLSPDSQIGEFKVKTYYIPVVWSKYVPGEEQYSVPLSEGFETLEDALSALNQYWKG